jgi:hypothetical protein
VCGVASPRQISVDVTPPSPCIVCGVVGCKEFHVTCGKVEA